MKSFFFEMQQHDTNLTITNYHIKLIFYFPTIYYRFMLHMHIGAFVPNQRDQKHLATLVHKHTKLIIHRMFSSHV
jgi:hypothetical protein